VYTDDFKRRFSSLLSFEFRNMEIPLVVDILQPNVTAMEQEPGNEAAGEVDLERLKSEITILDFRRV
jgi:hypothetical protein